MSECKPGDLFVPEETREGRFGLSKVNENGRHVVIGEFYVRETAEQVVARWNALAGYNPEAVKEVVEAARRFYDFPHDLNLRALLGQELAKLDGEEPSVWMT